MKGSTQFGYSVSFKHADFACICVAGLANIFFTLADACFPSTWSVTVQWIPTQELGVSF